MIEVSPSFKRVRWHLLILSGLFLLSFVSYILLRPPSPPTDDSPRFPFLFYWFACFLPYFVACAFVLLTKPLSGRWLRVELGVLLVGALLFRVLLISLPAGLSPDVWRYLWDARVTLHGYSPYVYPPADQHLVGLRHVLFQNIRFRDVPTAYPPFAEYIYIIASLLSSETLYGIRSLLLIFEMVSCGMLILLLLRRGLDPRRVVFYAWCPAPIVEYTIGGHSDAICIMLMLLAIFFGMETKTRSRVLSGLFIGLATLTRFYPILLLVAVIRRRDWLLVGTCLLTICIGYLPFIILGHGQVLGFITTYLQEQSGNAGIVQGQVQAIAHSLHVSLSSTLLLEKIVAVLFIGGVATGILFLRARYKVSMEAAAVLLIGATLCIASHVLPWYIPPLLPWLAVLEAPRPQERWPWLRVLGVGLVWYYVCAEIFEYTGEPIKNLTRAVLGVAVGIVLVVHFYYSRRDGKEQVQREERVMVHG